MKKLAIFVEGQTEQLFVTELLKQIAGEKDIEIEVQQAGVSKTGGRIFKIIRAASSTTDKKYFVLIKDCRGEHSVKSDIIDTVESLTRQSYCQIIGIRDVYPVPPADMPSLVKHLRYGVPTRYIPINIMLAVMEIEAWFLAEFNHYEKIHVNLTIEKIINGVGFDPSTDDMEQRPHPAEDLHNIYQLVKLAYTKRQQNTLRTVNALDYEHLYCTVRNNVKKLGQLLDHFDNFLS